MNYRVTTHTEREALRLRGCYAESWESVEVSEDFRVEQLRNVRFEGSVRIGSNSRIADSTIANYHIGDNCTIDDVLRMECRYPTTFGEGVRVAAVNENGGRTAVIYREITAQEAYMMTMLRNRRDMVSRMESMIVERSEAHRTDIGRVGDGSTIIGARFIREVRIEERCRIEGTSHLENGTVGEGSYVGIDVRGRDFIIDNNARVDGASSIERCFVGENSVVGNGFTAVDTLMFANCHFENGEAASVFAGPFTVSHHKSSLLIAGIFSFFNAGSGTNQSNHLFKSGAVHQAVHQRGTKFGSSAYVMSPAIEGPYTVVLGRHTRHHDTQDMPFSYLIEEGGESLLMPALALKSYGTIRDIEKWKSRDGRTLKRDNICFDEFNPFILGKMLRGVDILTRLEEENPEAKSYNYNRTTIRATMITRGKRLYNSAIGASIGALLEGGDYSRATYDGSEWIDLAGQYIPLGEVERMASDIASGNLSLESIKATLGRLMAEYRDMAAAYAYNLLWQLMGAKPSEEEVQSIIASSKNILRQMREATEQDRQRDTGLDMMVGYGYDFRDEKEQEADFRNTR
jgi:carbonic anhydrase/acetyltransferase-like protein (isoleucine patch superfamily)